MPTSHAPRRAPRDRRFPRARQRSARAAVGGPRGGGAPRSPRRARSPGARHRRRPHRHRPYRGRPGGDRAHAPLRRRGPARPLGHRVLARPTDPAAPGEPPRRCPARISSAAASTGPRTRRTATRASGATASATRCCRTWRRRAAPAITESLCRSAALSRAIADLEQRARSSSRASPRADRAASCSTSPTCAAFPETGPRGPPAGGRRPGGCAAAARGRACGPCALRRAA